MNKLVQFKCIFKTLCLSQRFVCFIYEEKAVVLNLGKNGTRDVKDEAGCAQDAVQPSAGR